MPGIVGLITKMPRQRAESELNRMLRSICHESFYASGTWIDEVLGVYVGWVAHRGSFSDGMPLQNEQHELCLVFSGEEFPDADTVENLRSRGHHVESDGPSYLVHLYEEDANFPASLNGRFHGVIADQRRRSVMLFNDRYGMRRIYYHESKDAFYFAAEAKAILAVRPELRRINPRGLGEYIACGCALENRTIFENIHVLPPASAWIFQDGSVAKRNAYFRAEEWEQQTPLEAESYYQQLREIFSRKLPRYFNGRERVGMSLTGGLDTRMIMAWQKSPPGSLPCYSFGGIFRDCQDVILARRLARICGQTYEVIRVGDEFLSRFPHYAERAVYLTDGCANVSRACDLYTNERARQIAPIRMTGNYGSEVLRGLAAFKPVEPARGLFSPDVLAQVNTAGSTYADMRRGHAVSFAAFRQLPTHHFGILALEETQVSTRSPFVDNDLVKTAFRAPNSAVLKSDIFAGNDECVRLISDGQPALNRIRTDRGFLAGSALSGAWLEFTFKAEYAYDYGMPQWLSRTDHSLKWLHLERLFLGRHKFYHYRVWYRDALANYIREMLLDSRTLSRPYVERKGVERIVKGHLEEGRNYTSEIHKLLTLEIQHRLFVDAN